MRCNAIGVIDNKVSRFNNNHKSGRTAYKTSVSKNFFLMLFLRSQVSKRVDNDTKNEIKDNNNHNKVEEQIIEDTGSVATFLLDETKKSHHI